MVWGASGFMEGPLQRDLRGAEGLEVEGATGPLRRAPYIGTYEGPEALSKRDLRGAGGFFYK